jgi:YcxB-like protein
MFFTWSKRERLPSTLMDDAETLDSVVINYRLTKSEYLSFARRAWFVLPSNRRSNLAAGIVLLSGLILCLSGFGWGSFGIEVGGTYLVLNSLFFVFAPHRWWQRNQGSASDRVVEVSSSGINFQTSVVTSNIKWSGIKAAQETKNLFVFQTASFWFIPKTAIPSDDQVRLRQLLKSRKAVNS